MENPAPAVATAGFEDFWKGGLEPITLSGKKLRIGTQIVVYVQLAELQKGNSGLQTRGDGNQFQDQGFAAHQPGNRCEMEGLWKNFPDT